MPSESNAAESSDVSWDFNTTDEWKRVVAGWEWDERAPGEWIKKGHCPRCNHPMSVLHQGGVAGLVKGEPAPGPAFARCNCGAEHRGRPTDLANGCGASGTIAPPTGTRP